MNGDVSMLLNYVKAIVKGFVKPDDTGVHPVINVRELKALGKNEWQLASIDNHVSQILDRMQEANQHMRALPLEELKEWMWNHRGSVNVRVESTHVKPWWHNIANSLSDYWAKCLIISNA